MCHPIPAFSSFSIPVLDSSNIHFYFNLLLVSLLCLSFGFITRLSALMSTGLFFWLIGSTISCAAGKNPSYIPWNHAIVFFNLLILSVSRVNTRFSVDKILFKKKKATTQKNWPVFLLKFNLVYAYFAGGIAKLQHGLDWMNGYSLQTQLIYRHLNLNTPHVLPIIDSYFLLVAISIIVVFAEVILFPLSLFNSVTALICIIGSLAFQALFAFLIELKWMRFFGWSYLIYFLEIVAMIIASRRYSPSKTCVADPEVVCRFRNGFFD